MSVFLYEKHKDGDYKYRLLADYKVMLGKCPVTKLARNPDKWIEAQLGEGFLYLVVRAGYEWDGPSGPTYDRHENMRASLIHDELYELMRAGVLPQECRDWADQIFKKVCIQDGMTKAWAHLCYLGLKVGGASSAARTPRFHGKQSDE